MPVVHAAPIVHQQRYARCSVADPRDYTKCPDVATKEGGKYYLEFMVRRQRCSAIEPEDPGVWAYTVDLKIHKGRVTGIEKYNNYAEGAQDVPDDYGVTFTFTGRFLTSKRLHLTLKAKVTTTGTDHADCAGTSFTEAHDLTAVGF
jgi:hypothetical protein